jgi:hypothetical protein
MKLGSIAAVVLVISQTAAYADTELLKAAIGAPQEVDVPIVQPTRASPTVVARYRTRVENIRTHHLVLPTRAATVPFSLTLSENKPKIKNRKEALLSDGIDVKGKIAASSKAKMDYNYVSPVAEPSAAARGQEILTTFNWGALWSEDGGNHFSQLDPYGLFEAPPAAVGSGFCCDQVVLYLKSVDLMVWFLQGDYNEGGNTVRLLVAKGEDIRKRRWHLYDFSPQSIGKWSGEWFDYPDLAATDKHLFISLNVFTTSGDGFTKSVVLRLPLEQLAAYSKVDIGVFVSDTEFSARFAQGSRGRMFWASHRDTAAMVVRSWSDDADQPLKGRIVAVERWTRPDNDTVSGAEGPNGSPWLNRLDERITAGWASGDIVGFAWTSGKIEAGDGADYPYPHVRVAILRRGDLESGGTAILHPVSEPHIWSSKFAISYPAAAPNEAGDVGIGLYFGGSKHFPSAAVGFFRQTDQNWETILTVLATGKNTPRCRKSEGVDNKCGAWGDYISIRPDPNDAHTWQVAVHTAEDEGDVEPKVVITYAPFRVNANTPAATVSQ